MTDVDKVIYVDSDTVFVNKVSLVWKLFHEMNQSHLTAMVLEDLEPNKSVYSSEQVKIPYFGKQGTVEIALGAVGYKNVCRYSIISILEYNFINLQVHYKLYRSEFRNHVNESEENA